MLLNLVMEGNPFPPAVVDRGNVHLLQRAVAGRILMLDANAVLPEIRDTCHLMENSLCSGQGSINSRRTYSGS